MKSLNQIRDQAVAERGPAFKAGLKHARREVEVELGLARLRGQRGLSQNTVAENLSMTQANVSRIEHQDDLQIATLENYVHGLGGELEIHAVFDDGDKVRLSIPEPLKLGKRSVRR